MKIFAVKCIIIFCCPLTHDSQQSFEWALTIIENAQWYCVIMPTTRPPSLLLNDPCFNRDFTVKNHYYQFIPKFVIKVFNFYPPPPRYASAPADGTLPPTANALKPPQPVSMTATATVTVFGAEAFRFQWETFLVLIIIWNKVYDITLVIVFCVGLIIDNNNISSQIQNPSLVHQSSASHLLTKQRRMLL